MKNFMLIFAMSLLLSACGIGNKVKEEDKSSLEFASGIAIIEGNGYYKIDIKNPWKEGTMLQSYILVPAKEKLPEDLPSGTIIRTPIKRALVYSAVHAGIIKEITGSVASISGICDYTYFNMPEVQAGISKGSIADCGSSMSPSIEKIIETKPDAIILSPFQNAGYGTLLSLKIPIIECADYMENSPLGRAEWVKFFGLLYDDKAAGDSIFNNTRDNYMRLLNVTQAIVKKPKVITETVINGMWYVPGGNSYMAQIIADAGGDYPWKDDKSTGSLQLDFNQVFEKAHDADIWLIKTYNQAVTHNSLKNSYALNADMDAFKKNGIYACDTKATTLFEDFPFHPDILLREYISIFHPELLKGYTSKYFKRVTE